MTETAVLISIKPDWIQKIFDGEKTVEIRKTAPKLEPPFICYIYCTKPRYEYDDFFIIEETRFVFGGGKIVGEFVCDAVENLDMDSTGLIIDRTKEYTDWEPCMTKAEMLQYTGGMKPYGWHISSVKKYEMPLPLSAFKIPCANPKRTCCECQLWNNGRYQISGCALAEIEKPPQSWRYVQVNQDRMEQMYGGPQDAEETARAMREAQRMFYADLSKVRGGQGRIDIEIGRGLSKDRTYFIQKYGLDPLAQEDENAEKGN